MKTLSADEILEQVGLLEGWSVAGGQLTRSFQFKDFVQSIAFVNRIAALAEAADHHPDIDIRYNRVDLRLITHSANGLTGKDFELARAASGEFSAVNGEAR